MKLKELGKTGVFLPEIGLGTWDYKGDTAALHKGIAAGALFIDTAESYGTESLVGRLLREVRHTVHESVFVATKVSPQNFRAKDLRNSVDSSLSKLGVDSIDLVQLHEPNAAIPIEETPLVADAFPYSGIRPSGHTLVVNAIGFISSVSQNFDMRAA